MSETALYAMALIPWLVVAAIFYFVGAIAPGLGGIDSISCEQQTKQSEARRD